MTSFDKIAAVLFVCALTTALGVFLAMGFAGAMLFKMMGHD